MSTNWMEPKSLAYFRDIRSQIRNLQPLRIVEHVTSLIEKHETWIDESCINLYAASNRMSPKAKALLSSTIATRVAEGHPGSKHQTGVKYMEGIEAIVAELLKRLFNATYAEYRVLSGSMANLFAYTALTRPGDTVMSLNVPSGGHISCQRFGVAGQLGLTIRPIPYNGDEMNIDVEELAEAASKFRPKLLILSASLILFPFPLAQIQKIADDVRALIMYDGSHVDGLIAGGQFQEPLDEGADVFTSSTYKTLAGPPGGFVLTNDEQIAKKIDNVAFPGMTANAHYHRLAATAITLAELLQFGSDYAEQVIANAQAFGKALASEGFDVLASQKGYTKSHQVIVDISSSHNGYDAATLLEKANIICNANLIPKDRLNMLWHPSGLRLGVQEMTKLGMKTAQMKTIAAFIRRVLIDNEDPERVKAHVTEFRKEYTRVHYCF